MNSFSFTALIFIPTINLYRQITTVVCKRGIPFVQQQYLVEINVYALTWDNVTCLLSKHHLYTYITNYTGM